MASVARDIVDVMAGGWSRDGAVLDQIEDTITDGVLAARARLPAGEGPTIASMRR